LLPAGPPDESARFPFAPRNPSFSSVGYGSPFQVRYVSAGWLFLKPLGTFFTMLPEAEWVKAFLLRKNCFPQDLSGSFRCSYNEPSV
jgi:hypothetical protein